MTQIQFRDLVRLEHCVTGLPAEDARQAIYRTAALLVASGHAQAQFPEDVWAREQAYPTGLPTQPHAVAIPHADPQHVIQTAVGVAILEQPVKFAQMGSDGSTFLDVRILFLLAIKEREKQVEMIRQVMAVIQDQRRLETLQQVSDPKRMVDLLSSS